MSRPFKVLFTGTYSSLDVGNMAMVLGAVKGVGSVFSRAEFELLSSYPSVDRERYSDYHLKVISRDRGKNMLHGVLLFLRSLIYCVVCGLLYRTFRGDSRNVGCENEVIRAFQNADIVIDLEGHSFTGADGKPSLLITLLTLQSAMFAKMLGKKFVLCAQSIEPPLSWKCKLFAELVVLLADGITARDTNTFAYLQKAKTKAPVYLTADLAYLLEARNSCKVEMLVEGVPRPLVAVLPRKWACKHGFEQYVGVFFGKLVNFLTNDLGCTVLLIPHWVGPDSLDDRPLIREIGRFVRKKEKVLFVNDEFSAGELKALLGKCDLVVSANLHSTILGASMGVPFFVLSSSSKFEALPIRRFEATGNFLDIRDINQDPDYLIHAIKSDLSYLVNHLDEERKRLQEILPEYIENSLRNAHIIALLSGVT